MTIEGRVTNIRFRNEQTGYTVFNIVTGNNSVNQGYETVTGVCPPLRKDQRVSVTGEYVDTKYGKQIKASTVMEVRPTDVEGIFKYLSSGLIKNIGPVFARAIVNAFGEETLDVLDNEPERLKELKGVGPKRVNSVIEAVKETRAIRAIMIWLKRYDLPNGLAAKIYKTYEAESVAKLEENPYRLADDIKGVGFKKADMVAQKLGLTEDCPFRILSGLRAFLEDRANEGHTCFPFGEMVVRTASEEYLNIDEDKVREIAQSGQFIQVGTEEEGMAFLPRYLHAENKTAERIAKLLANGNIDNKSDINIDLLRRNGNVTLSRQQAEAVAIALRFPMMILTGGPGTGKTTTTRAIISELEKRGYKIILAAPTGRAAKRMNEATGRPAKTIHRLLKYQQGKFTKDEDNPIEADAVIVDEASMIDAVLMKYLLKAVSDKTKLIIVGDTDQLPSVGAGSVLRDLIASRAIPVIHLTEIYRQAQGSDIIMNAHRVNCGRQPVIDNHKPGTDFRFIECEDKEKVADYIVQLVKSDIPRKLGINSKDIQVLTPMRRDWDPIGAIQLNIRLQDALNRGGEKVASKGTYEFRIGDRIMQTRNNYEKDIFNGDMGTVLAKIKEPDSEDKAVMLADFDGVSVRLNQADLDDVELAYACTVHKSQGSEYPCVVMPIHTSQYVMLKRNLLYTGITRAKKQCLLVGNMRAILTAVHQEDNHRRYTRLNQKILEAIRINPRMTTRQIKF